MISRNHVIKDKLGFNCFVRQEYDYIYLTHTLKPQLFFDTYYVDQFPLQQNLYVQNINKLKLDHYKSLCKQITDTDMTDAQFQSFIDKFPIEVKEMILKTVFSLELSELSDF